MGVCCKCDSKPDILTEVKKSSVAEGFLNPHLILTDSMNSEQILLKQKENPLKEYSLLLFQEFNKFRTEPQQYYEDSIKYNFDDIVKDLIYFKEKNIKRDLHLQWSTKKEIIINSVMNDKSIKDIKTKLSIIKQKFESIFDIIILFVQGNYHNIKESLWDALTNFKKLDEKMFHKKILNKIDYCVIYSIKSDNLSFKKLYREENDNIDIDIDIDVDIIVEKYDDNYENKKDTYDKIISFYFLFNYLEEGNNNYNIIDNNVVQW